MVRVRCLLCTILLPPDSGRNRREELLLCAEVIEVCAFRHSGYRVIVPERKIADALDSGRHHNDGKTGKCAGFDGLHSLRDNDAVGIGVGECQLADGLQAGRQRNGRKSAVGKCVLADLCHGIGQVDVGEGIISAEGVVTDALEVVPLDGDTAQPVQTARTVITRLRVSVTECPAADGHDALRNGDALQIVPAVKRAARDAFGAFPDDKVGGLGVDIGLDIDEPAVVIAQSVFGGDLQPGLIERAAPDGIDRAWNIQRLDARAARECRITDDLQTVGERDGGQPSTAVESAVPDLAHRSRDLDRGQLLTACKCPIADRHQRGRELDFSQVGAALKRAELIVRIIGGTERCDGIGERNAGEEFIAAARSEGRQGIECAARDSGHSFAVHLGGNVEFSCPAIAALHGERSISVLAVHQIAVDEVVIIIVGVALIRRQLLHADLELCLSTGVVIRINENILARIHQPIQQEVIVLSAVIVSICIILHVGTLVQIATGIQIAKGLEGVGSVLGRDEMIPDVGILVIEIKRECIHHLDLLRCLEGVGKRDECAAGGAHRADGERCKKCQQLFMRVFHYDTSICLDAIHPI